MMINYNIFILILSVIVYHKLQLSSTACSNSINEKTCLHSGTFNNVTCKCGCYPGYTGNNCQFFNNTLGQSTLCSILSTSLCNLTLSTLVVNDYCPVMCQNITKTPLLRCTIDSCLNLGHFNATTCQCKCPPGYLGRACEDNICSQNDSSQCSQYKVENCNYNQVIDAHW
jgi:hypothetical protein